jgi:hypothetical protein
MEARRTGQVLAVPVFGIGGVVLAALEGAVTDVPAGFETLRGARSSPPA